MKKVLSLLLAAFLLLGLAACDDEQLPEEGEMSAAISRTVLVDEENVKIIALSFDAQTMIGPELKLQIENNTDKKLVFQVRNTAVNNYVVGSIMSVEVEAGQKEKCSMILSNTDLQTCGVTTIAKMEMDFQVFDASNWKPYLNTTAATLETTAAKDFSYTCQHEGVTVYEENGIKIVIKEPVQSSGAQVYIQNGSEEMICVETVLCKVGGVEIDPLFGEYVPAGRHMVAEVIFAEEILEENNLSEISEIAIKFQILNEIGEVIAEANEATLKVK